jgi:hypothetical protein
MGIASILVAQCRSWVIHDRCGRSHASMSVRYCRKADKRADVSGRPLCANSDLTRRSKRHRYSITSSARPSNGSGNVMPRALAVSRFRNISLSWPAGLQVGGFLAIENAASVNAS